MKLAIIGLKGISGQNILKEAEKYFDSVDFLNIRDIEVNINSTGSKILCNGEEIKDYDCIYCRGSYKYALLLTAVTELLDNKCYMPTKPRAFIAGHNKFLTSLELYKHKIPTPQTYIAATLEAAKNILEKISYPIIIKLPSGTHGKGVMFADSYASASSVLDTLEVSKQPYILQEYIETNSTDIRALVLGDKVIGAMRRKAKKGEKRANIHMGGMGYYIELDNQTERTAIKAAESLGIDICAVDILEDVPSKVIEVNLSPGLSGITKATGINYADKIAKFLCYKTKEFKSKKHEVDYQEVVNNLDNKSEIITNVDLKLGRIRLPPIVTKLSRFQDDDDIIIKTFNGKIIIKKSN